MDPILYEQNRIKMSRMAMTLGIAALATSIVMFTVPYIAVALAGVSILLSFFAKGNRTSYEKESKIGFLTSIAAIVISCFVVFSVVHAFKTNPEYRKNVEGLISTMYGETLVDENGNSIEDMMDGLFGK